MKAIKYLSFCLLFTTASSFAEVFEGYDMQLNGAAALISGDSVLRVTNLIDGTGSAFISAPFGVDTNTSFSTFFQFRIGDGSGADGLVFVIQNDPDGASILASGGGGLGFRNIDNSIGVEIDEYLNGEWSDPNSNHLGIDLNGSVISVVTHTPAVDVDSGTSYFMWVDYDGISDELTVFFNTSATKPDSPVMTYNLNLASILGSNAYVGFVSGRGAANNNHDIEDWSLSWAGPTPVPVPSLRFWSLLLLALLVLGLAGYHLVPHRR